MKEREREAREGEESESGREREAADKEAEGEEEVAGEGVNTTGGNYSQLLYIIRKGGIIKLYHRTP